MCEYLTAPQHNLVPIPDNVTFEEAARFGYIGTAYAALRKANAGPGETIFINGLTGTLGLGATFSALGRGVTRILGTARDRAGSNASRRWRRAASRCSRRTGAVRSPTGPAALPAATASTR